MGPWLGNEAVVMVKRLWILSRLNANAVVSIEKITWVEKVVV